MVREIRPPFYFYWSAMRFMSSLFPHIFHTGHTRIFSTRLKKHQFKAHCLLAPHPVWEILFYGVGPKEILLQCESNDKINDTAHKNREENIHLWYKKWWLDFGVYWGKNPISQWFFVQQFQARKLFALHTWWYWLSHHFSTGRPHKSTARVSPWRAV